MEPIVFSNMLHIQGLFFSRLLAHHPSDVEFPSAHQQVCIPDRSQLFLTQDWTFSATVFASVIIVLISMRHIYYGRYSPVLLIRVRFCVNQEAPLNILCARQESAQSSDRDVCSIPIYKSS